VEHNIVSSLKVELQYGPCGLEIVLLEAVVARCWVLKDRVTGSSRPVSVSGLAWCWSDLDHTS
jgi:hypothetical protein